MLCQAVSEPRQAQASHAQINQQTGAETPLPVRSVLGTAVQRRKCIPALGAEIKARDTPRFVKVTQPTSSGAGDPKPRRHHRTPVCHVSRPRAPVLPSLGTREDKGGLRGQANAQQKEGLFLLAPCLPLDVGEVTVSAPVSRSANWACQEVTRAPCMCQPSCPGSQGTSANHGPSSPKPRGQGRPPRPSRGRGRAGSEFERRPGSEGRVGPQSPTEGRKSQPCHMGTSCLHLPWRTAPLTGCGE